MSDMYEGPGLAPERFDAYLDFLNNRPGWAHSPNMHIYEDGYPDPEGTWVYEKSFDGIPINRIDNAPSLLQCWFDFEDEAVTITVATAGNELGCEQHNQQDISIPATDQELVQLEQLLNKLEPRAQRLDPRELLECRFLGACGE